MDRWERKSEALMMTARKYDCVHYNQCLDSEYLNIRRVVCNNGKNCKRYQKSKNFTEELAVDAATLLIYRLCLAVFRRKMK